MLQKLNFLTEKSNVLRVHDVVTCFGLKADFYIKQGGIGFLLGPNGIGKTTLLKTILGLLPKQEGTVEIYSINAEHKMRILNNLSISSRYLSYVPQSFSLFQDIKVLEAVALGGIRTLWNAKIDVVKARSILTDVGILNLQDRLVSTLSGGELALVNLARALMQDTPYLLVDEGEASLDLGRRRDFYSIIEHQAKNIHKGVLLVTHNLEVALRYMKPDILHLVMPNKTIKSVKPKLLSSELLSEVFGAELTYFAQDGKIMVL